MQCAPGHNHSLFLDHLGNVWSCGNNDYGQLGLGDWNPRTKAEKINNLPPISSISGGCKFSLFLDENGSVWGCGYNAIGQLGLGDNNNRNQAEQITNLPKIISLFSGDCFSKKSIISNELPVKR